MSRMDSNTALYHRWPPTEQPALHRATRGRFGALFAVEEHVLVERVAGICLTLEANGHHPGRQREYHVLGHHTSEGGEVGRHVHSASSSVAPR